MAHTPIGLFDHFIEDKEVVIEAHFHDLALAGGHPKFYKVKTEKSKEPLLECKHLKKSRTYSNIKALHENSGQELFNVKRIWHWPNPCHPFRQRPWIFLSKDGQFTDVHWHFNVQEEEQVIKCNGQVVATLESSHWVYKHWTVKVQPGYDQALVAGIVIMLMYKAQKSYSNSSSSVNTGDGGGGLSIG